MNVHLITPIVCVVCIFYTCVGGLKAVVWTDVVQLVMMFFAIALVIIKGTIDVGGFGFVWDKALASGRIEGPEYVNIINYYYYTLYYGRVVVHFWSIFRYQLVSHIIIQKRKKN